MKKLDFRLLGIVFSLIIVLYLAIDFKLKLDSNNENYRQLNTVINEIRLNFIEHIDITKESIINLHFNNDHFIEHFKSSKQTTIKLAQLYNNLNNNYPALFKEFNIYRNLQKKLKHDTMQFIKENAMIKNSISILDLNTNKYISLYDEKYLNTLIILLNEFKNIKNDMNSNKNISKSIYKQISENKNSSKVHNINFIHIDLIYTNLPKFKLYFYKIKNSNIKDTIDNMQQNLNIEAKKQKNKMKNEFYLILAIVVVLFIVVIVLINNLKNESIKILKLKRENERSLKKDHITSLLNRTAFHSDIQRIKNSSVIILDITDFGSINSITGFKGGNEILIQLSTLLQEKIKNDKRCYKNLYRVGIDQFAFISKLTQQKDLTSLALEIIEKIEKTIFTYNDLKFQLYMHAGISNKRPYLINGETAIRKTKKSFQKIAFYDDSMKENKTNISSNMQMLTKIETALSNRKIKPFFQPIVDLKTKKPIKYEALVRLIDDDDKIISPYFFLELSKKSKHYTKITMLMIEQSLEFIKQTKNSVSINLSYQDINDDTTVEFIAQKLKSNRDITNLITFELLESEDIDNYDELLSFIDFIKSFGCKLAIDDFGSGYSNFTHLFNMKPDIVKIDGSLIKNICDDKNSKNIVEALVSLAKKSEIQTVAEFVENEQIDQLISRMGIDFGQGYYYAEPKDLLKETSL
ncbi:MAG: GGDEF domain-containing phosphodiesterase [Campylobacterota bacterium]|nr:GGDEF domain-containing phosphodiesterase [Campylobacterota bacterium]